MWDALSHTELTVAQQTHTKVLVEMARFKLNILQVISETIFPSNYFTSVKTNQSVVMY